MAGGTQHPGGALLITFTGAWNALDADGLLALVHPDFEMHRLKGDVLRPDDIPDAVERQSFGAAMRVYPKRLYGDSGDLLAAAVRVEFRFVETNELMGENDDAGAVFSHHDGALLYFAPKHTLADALEQAGLTEADLIEELSDAPPP